MSLSRLFRYLHGCLLALVCLTLSLVAWQQWQRQVSSRQSQAALVQFRQLLIAAEMSSRERGPMNALLGSRQTLDAARLQALQDARLRTDLAFDTLQSGLAGQAARVPAGEAADRLRRVAEAVQRSRNELQQARAAADVLAARPAEHRDSQQLAQTIDQMVGVVRALGQPASQLAQWAQQAHPALSDAVQGARMAAELREQAGLLGSLFTPALHLGRPFTDAERVQIEQTRGRLLQLRSLLELHLGSLPTHSATQLAQQRMLDRYVQVAGELQNRVIQAGVTGAGHYGLDPASFAARYVPEINTIQGLRDALLDQADDRVREARQRAQVALGLLGLVGAGLLTSLVLAMWVLRRRVIQPLAATTRALAALAKGDLSIELPTARGRDEVAAVLDAVGALRDHQVERRALAAERDQLIARLVEHSSTDYLTGLPNRRAFFEAADRTLSQAQRLGHDVAVVLLDLDHFKAVNDTHGHGVGDRTLVAVAQAIRATLRQGDLVARHGGEEFILLLSLLTPDAASTFAERLRTVIAGLHISTDLGGAIGITASMGLATSNAWGLELAGLLSRADQALYRAKAAGRNRVEVADLDAAPD